MVAADVARYLPFDTYYMTYPKTYREIGLDLFFQKLEYHSLSDQVCCCAAYWRHSEEFSLEYSLYLAPSSCIHHIHCHFFRCFCSHPKFHFYRQTWILFFLLVSMIPWLNSSGSSCVPFENEYTSTKCCFCHGSSCSMFQRRFCPMFNFCSSFFLSSSSRPPKAISKVHQCPAVLFFEIALCVIRELLHPW